MEIYADADLEDLSKCNPLSEVRFVHDYVQLIFQDCSINVCNRSTVVVDGEEYDHGVSGYCDAAVSLIGDSIVKVEFVETEYFRLHLTHGHMFVVDLSAEGGDGPEAFELGGGPVKGVIVQHNS